MAETTEFAHDQLGHILADHLVEVPSFQRSYSWERTNVQEYLADLARARDKQLPYFMGTIVFARPQMPSGRRQIVDGQQRLATTAILLIAVRDRLRAFNRHDLADSTSKRYLRRFSIQEESDVDSLILNPDDQDAYDALVNSSPRTPSSTNKLYTCYDECVNYLQGLAVDPVDYRKLIEVIEQLDKSVQVLVAVATDLPEAYVIFETLNDRGADLTTADLLKNYLFSQARQSQFSYVQHRWNSIETNLGGKPEEMVKFVRFEYMSHHGKITTRKLYRALQDEVEEVGSKAYVQRLKSAADTYLALRDPDSEYWSDVNVDVRDALVAYRRFGFESNYPILLAAFREWDRAKACKLMLKLVKWSVRAQFAGSLGTGTAEEAFPSAAVAIATGGAHNQTEVRRKLDKIIPSDGEFRTHFVTSGKISPNRAKYILAMLEKASGIKANGIENPIDWTSSAVTLEHIMPVSFAGNREDLQVKVNEIGNLTLLEKRLNHQLGSKSYEAKVGRYTESAFSLTNQISEFSESMWSTAEITERTKMLANLACSAFAAE